MVNREYEVYDNRNILVIRTLLKDEGKPYADKFQGYILKRGVKVYVAKQGGK